MKITPEFLQLASLIIAPAAALGGIWLSPHLTSRVDHRRWLREQRASAYLNAIQAMQGIVTAHIHELSVKAMFQVIQEKFPEYKDVKSKEVPDEEVRDFVEEYTRERLTTFFTSLIDIQSQVALYGTKAARQICEGLLHDLVNAPADKGHSIVTNALERFTTVCREDLRVTEG